MSRSVHQARPRRRRAVGAISSRLLGMLLDGETLGAMVYIRAILRHRRLSTLLFAHPPGESVAPMLVMTRSRASREDVRTVLGLLRPHLSDLGVRNLDRALGILDESPWRSLARRLGFLDRTPVGPRAANGF